MPGRRYKGYSCRVAVCIPLQPCVLAPSAHLVGAGLTPAQHPHNQRLREVCKRQQADLWV